MNNDMGTQPSEDKKESIGEQIGAEVGREIGKKVEQEVKEHIQEKKEEKNKKKKSRAARRAGYVVSVILSMAFLFIISSFREWGWTFITSDWSQVVDLVRFSIYVTVVGYAALILYDAKLMYYLVRLVMDVVGIYVGIRVFQVYPFDFSEFWGGWDWFNDFFPWVIMIGIIAGVISIIARSGKLMAGKEVYD